MSGADGTVVASQSSMRRKAIAGTVLALAMAASGSGQTRESVARRFALSPETTYIVEPLLPDGTPDYGAFLDARFGMGVTADNNAAVALRSLFGSESDGGTRFRGGFIWEDYDAFVRWRAKGKALPSRCERQKQLDAFQSAWSRFGWDLCDSRKCPLVVDVVEANDVALDQMVEASLRPRYWVPYPDGVSLRYVEWDDLPPRFAREALRARGLLALERGDWTAAARDALALQRLGTLVSRGRNFFDILSGVSQRNMASDVLIELALSDAFSPPEAEELIGALDRIGAMPTDWTAERLGDLATLLEMSRTRGVCE
jgi:hypothetical protein